MKAHQLANVIGVSNSTPVGISADPFHDGSNDPMIMSREIHNNANRTTTPGISHATMGLGNYPDGNITNDMQNLIVGLKKPVSYNLQGIKDRLKER